MNEGSVIMLYTVVPLERIYRSRTKADLTNYDESEDTMEFKDIAIANGFVRARREKNHYIVDGIHSTDMNDYLDDRFAPGSIIDL